MLTHRRQPARSALIALLSIIAQFAFSQSTTKPETGSQPSAITKGGVTSTGAFVVTKPAAETKPIVQQIIYIVIGDARQWTSTDGKVLLGKLIAFEQTTETITDGTAISQAKPFTPPQITVLRDGKARLLIQNKPYEIPLERLSEPDRELIEKTRIGIAAQTKKEPEKK